MYLVIEWRPIPIKDRVCYHYEDSSNETNYCVFTESARSNPSMFCGLWVLTGMLVFIVMEKAFAGQQDSSPILVKQVEPSKTTICSDDNANKAFVKTPSTIQVALKSHLFPSFNLKEMTSYPLTLI